METQTSDFFNIVTGALQGGTLTPYLSIICVDYLLGMSIYLMKGNGFILEKARNGRYHAQIMTNTDYAADIVPLANTSAQVESLLHSLDWAAVG